MFDVFYIGPAPGLFAHEKPCESIEHARQQSRTRFFWIVNYLSDYSDFDFLWEPPPWQAHQRHAWPSQWQKDSGTYLVPRSGYDDTNYRTDIVIYRRPDRSVWTVPDTIDVDRFDFSWHPDPADPPYVYEFATEWNDEGGPIYPVPGAHDRKYVNDPRAPLLPSDHNWHELVSGAQIDRSWRPHPRDPAYIYVFGNQHWPAEIMPTAEYRMPDAVDRKYMTWPVAQLPPVRSEHWREIVPCEWDYSWVPDPGDPAYIYVFGNQHWPAEKMPTVEYHMPGATERKYMPGPVARLPVDMTHWHIPAGVDTTDMDFSWVPDPGEPAYIYQFATQHQKTGGPQYRVPGATEIKYLDMMRAAVSQEAVPIVEIDHMDGNAGQIPNTVKRVRYFDNYRDTLIRLARNLEGRYEHVWVCSSICDYTNFDFSWHPEIWQSTMLHVFASDDQKFGDTFYMHVPTFADRAERKALLEWTSVNYVPRTRVPRRPMPVVQHTEDSHVDQVKHYPGSAPLTVFTNRSLEEQTLPAVNLWREEVKTVVPLDAGAGAVIVPKAAVAYIKTQVYDYPNIDKTRRTTLRDHPLDVIFISNGEVNAEENWERLKDVMEQNHNRWHRIDGVDGRVAAYQAAARASTTPWFFAVFAKLYVSGQFDWSWQPDRLQQPKHYIFHARNDVTGLTYGHQAMIAYNRQMTLENTAPGLDFTLDQPHEVVPVFSGVANYAFSPWMAWRTAFREVIKLRHSLPDVENEYRLDQWLTVGRGENGVFSVMGAQDAVEYYESVAGEFAELRKTYEWSWLAAYASIKRPQLFTQSNT